MATAAPFEGLTQYPNMYPGNCGYYTVEPRRTRRPELIDVHNSLISKGNFKITCYIGIVSDIFELVPQFFWQDTVNFQSHLDRSVVFFAAIDSCHGAVNKPENEVEHVIFTCS